jgi:hypothetical protein
MKIPKRHKKPRVFLLVDCPEDIFKDLLGLMNAYAKQKKRIILCMGSEDPVPVELQAKLRKSTKKVLQIDGDGDMLKALEDLSGVKLPRKDDTRYIG